MTISIKKYLPKSLLGRSLLIIVTPLVVLQLVSAAIFYETHWDKVTLKLARGVAGDIAAVINLMRLTPGTQSHRRIFNIADSNMGLEVSLHENAVLPNVSHSPSGLTERMLTRAMISHVSKPFQIDTKSKDREVVITVQLVSGVLQVSLSRKRLFSSTAYVFVLWMVGTSLILFVVATIFMRNQVKPIRRLAIAADDFGKGRDVSQFKPEGASEVRLAASAFLAMHERIVRQISQRTDMLAGVSHDLRTPLTRMKLQLEMLGGDTVPGAEDLKADITEMEHMLDGYLDFARGEGGEDPRPTDVSALLKDAAAQALRQGGAVDLHTEGQLSASLRPNAFRRCLTNLIDNAIRYAKHVSVRAGQRGDAIEVTIDDDGPGIAEDQRDAVFKPFYRIEGSRNPGTGGVGLGMTIARDVLRSHGGDIELGDSPNGGLRVRLRVPL
ncbi:MAG: HAMP domain-containing protein [Alphaproteobacteria bacterium]|jgi:two-component system, OmpR family, osmolarity sensor histidine kinase EnvZ|nr:HAMP domain-containing protein [Alphaproteobacteria bacterium]